jgi:hypothetical protein
MAAARTRTRLGANGRGTIKTILAMVIISSAYAMFSWRAVVLRFAVGQTHLIHRDFFPKRRGGCAAALSPC